MSYYRTPEHRALRSEMIKRWKPWEKSTGPKSADGKKISAQRGYKGNVRSKYRELTKVLSEYASTLKRIY